MEVAMGQEKRSIKGAFNVASIGHYAKKSIVVLLASVSFLAGSVGQALAQGGYDGTYDAQLQTQPVKPWENDASYQRQASSLYQQAEIAKANADARYRTNMANCSSRFSGEMSRLSNTVNRNQSRGHTGMEKMTEFFGMGQVGANLQQCQTTAKTQHATAVNGAESRLGTGIDRLDQTFERQFNQAAKQRPVQHRAAPVQQKATVDALSKDLAAHEKAKLDACQAQEIRELQTGKSSVSGKCKIILDNAKNMR